MVFIRKILCLWPILFCISCAKLSYLFEQGTGQLSLLNKARKNSQVLNDPRVPEKFKSKIKKIEKYKKYFYDYFAMKPGSIYTSTHLLKNPAVSYLVIASPFDVIKAKKECFPFVGCFPYLGFFSKNSAEEYSLKLQKENYITWIRPVYAYSTLGNFDDPILSSFFYYNDHELAELVFHELFHTLFFVKDEVELNENLANFVGKQMAINYFSYSKQERQRLANNEKFYHAYRKQIVHLISQLKMRYKKAQNLQKEQAEQILHKFMQNVFLPQLQALCQRFDKQKSCIGEDSMWNNARLAAYLTYEQKQERIKSYFQNFSGLKDFYNDLQSKYKEFKKKDIDNSFAQFLFPEK